MTAMQMQSDCAALLSRHGLRDFGDFFRYAEGRVISGHHARNVTRVELGNLKGFLKREHFVPWRDYLQSWWAGFGFVSKSQREWRALQALRGHGIRCPEPLAVGEQEGKAFLLVRDLPDDYDLISYLEGHALGRQDRVWLAHLVGKAISDLHAAGFTHPDLYAKHVFVDRAGRSIAFIDLQRTRQQRAVSWRLRWRDLAALNATLRDDLVSPRERLHCLFAYLRHTHLAEARRLGTTGAGPMLRAAWRRRARQAVCAITDRTRHLLFRRRIRRMRDAESLQPDALVIEYWRVAVRDQEAVSAEAPSRPASRNPRGAG